MYWNGHGMSGWGWFTMTLSSILLTALVIGVVLLVLHVVGRGAVSHQDRAEPSAEQLLAQRFALGEIDDEEYERRLASLRRHGFGRAGR
ncbi:SHOCT domain-containing protein [Streptomyces sp. NPDC050448]|uniref:SHOCT domain-containing protein n=1 Tax=Streptomyces sp. NPDC050448 TaxID=3155404 RepID=UPI003414D42B